MHEGQAGRLVDWIRLHSETQLMPVEVKLVISKREARLEFTSAGKTVDSESWKFDDSMTISEQKELARIMFDEGYDLMQFSVYGN